MKASKTAHQHTQKGHLFMKSSSFLIAMLMGMLTNYGCQPTNKTESGLDTNAKAQTTSKIPDSSNLENGIQVAMFIEQTAVGGMLEIEIGKLAADKAQNSGIKEFGKRMVEHYTKINLELNALASMKGLRLPGALPQKQQRQIREMSTVNSDYFERLYLKIVLAEQDKYIELFKGALSSPDGGVSGFARKFLPILETQRQQAYTLFSAIR